MGQYIGVFTLGEPHIANGPDCDARVRGTTCDHIAHLSLETILEYNKLELYRRYCIDGRLATEKNKKRIVQGVREAGVVNGYESKHIIGQHFLRAFRIGIGKFFVTSHD